MFGGFFPRLADDGNIQALADHLSDLSERNPFVGYCVIAWCGRAILQHEPVETSSIEPVHCGPAIEPVLDIRLNTLFAIDVDEERNNPWSPLPWTEGGRRSTDRRAPRAAAEAEASSDLRGKVELAASSSVATRPGVARAVPEVTMNGQAEPASTAPSVSIARLSVSGIPV